MAITSVRQGYEFIEGQYNYKTRIGITYKEWDLPMEIGKSNKSFKDGKPKCFNCEIYRHMARDCKKPKKEIDNRKCYECGRTRHIARDCRTKQRMKE